MKKNFPLVFVIATLINFTISQDIQELSLFKQEKVTFDPLQGYPYYYKISVPSHLTPCDLTLNFLLKPKATIQAFIDFSNHSNFFKHPTKTNNKLLIKTSENITMRIQSAIDVYIAIQSSQKTSGFIYFSETVPQKSFAISFIVFVAIAIVFLLIIIRVVLKSLFGIFPCLPRALRRCINKICPKGCVKYFEERQIRRRAILNPPVIQAEPPQDIKVTEILHIMEIQKKSLQEKIAPEGVQLEVKEELKSPDTESDLMCIICLTEKKSVKFLPCEHVCACFECSKQIIKSKRNCPLCRNMIDLVELE